MKKYYILTLLILIVGAVFGQTIEQTYQTQEVSTDAEFNAPGEKLAELTCSDTPSIATRFLPLCCTVIIVAGLAYVIKNAISEAVDCAAKLFVAKTALEML